MSTTVTYKGSTLTTADNNTKTLKTAGKYLEDDITLVDVSSATPTLQTKTKTYTPTESQQTESVTADSGYDGLDEVDVTVNAISSTYVGSGITRRSSTNMTVSGASVTAPAGYYESAGTKSVASGTAGTPTATKGTVSNHAVSVTPSVTNTTGYITGSTKTGTAVSVSASELVSGTLNVDSAGTKDVTNYASASIPSGTAGTPSASKGSVSNHSVSVTPSVTNSTGWITGSTKTGTAVSVSASELVSGSQTITDNANNVDVTNLASVNVAIPFSTIRTGSTEPSSSLGVNGDVYMQTGGGGGVTVEALSVTSNGTYTAPTGTAYSPVSVAVAPTLNPLSVTSNGTYTPTAGTGYGTVTVSVSVDTSYVSILLSSTGSVGASYGYYAAYTAATSLTMLQASLSTLSSTPRRVYLPRAANGRGLLYFMSTNSSYFTRCSVTSGSVTNISGSSTLSVYECDADSVIDIHMEYVN